MLKHGINDSTYDYICSHLCHLQSHEYVVDLDSWLLPIVVSMVIIIYVIHPFDFHDYNQDNIALIRSFNLSPWIFNYYIIKKYLLAYEIIIIKPLPIPLDIPPNIDYERPNSTHVNSRWKS